MRTTPAILAASLALVPACTSDRPNPVAPSLVAGPGLSASSWGPETPPFNVELILRDVGGGSAFGHVKFRQPNDAELVVNLDVWVRDLAPNTTYRLQRAADGPADGNCTSTSWLTLGRGTQAQAIVTDNRGTGRAELFRLLTSPVGSTFDIRQRVIDPTGAVVLESECYQFVVSQ